MLQLDEIRRRAGDPGALARGLDTIQDELRGLVAARARAPAAAGALADEAAALVAELDRAARAADLVEHGLDALLAHRGAPRARGADLAQARALNLRNARGAAAAIAGQVAAVTPADLLTPAGRPRDRAGPGAARRSASTGPSPRTTSVPHPRM